LTHQRAFSWFAFCMRSERSFRGSGPRPGSGRAGLKPTVRQIYALARALCTQTDTRWPDTRAEASELIERLRREDPLGER
jgi:hypothetical protein